MIHPLLWRHTRRQDPLRRLMLIAASCVAAGMAWHVAWPSALAESQPMSLALWIWATLAWILLAPMHASWGRVLRERDSGTLELLAVTRTGPRELLHTEAVLGQRWLARQWPILVLWGAWAIGSSFSTTFFRICCLTTFPLVTLCGSLAGVRLALAGRKSAWSLAGALLGIGCIGVFPIALDAVQSLPYFEKWSWLMTLKAHMVAVLIQATTASALWQSSERAMADGQVLPHSGVLAGGTPTFLRMLDRMVSWCAPQSNPFFRRERLRMLQRPSRLWGILLLALAPVPAPWIATSLIGCDLRQALGCNIVLTLAAAWFASAMLAGEAVQAEVDGHTADSLLTLPVAERDIIQGLALGRLYPLALGGLVSLPGWLLYATAVPAGLLAYFGVLMAAGCYVAAWSAVRRSWLRLTLPSAPPA